MKKIFGNVQLNSSFVDLCDDGNFNIFFSEENCKLIEHLHSKLSMRRGQLLAARHRKQEHYDQGKYPEYPPKDSEISVDQWAVAEVPERLLDRRVEICVPSSNSSDVSKLFTKSETTPSSGILDFEDTVVSKFNFIYSGYKNLHKVSDSLNSDNLDELPYPMVRLRNLHTDDDGIFVDGKVVPAAIVDAVVTFSTYGKKMVELGLNPCFYIPKIEESLESCWWNDLFTEIEKFYDCPSSVSKITYLIETLPAAYYAEDIIFNCKERLIGLNAGKWDRIFSDIKVFRERPERILPDRDSITMTQFWMDNYAKRLIKVCHERGALAIGGLASHVPDVSQKFRKVQEIRFREEKRYEYQIGHDGTWVSDHYFSEIVFDIFKKKNQLDYKLPYFSKFPDLIASCSGPKTLDCLKSNIRFCMKYIASWLQGNGTIILKNKIEDLSSLEISRAQIWQWRRHEIILDNGSAVNNELLKDCLEEEYEKAHRELQATISDEQSYITQETYLKSACELSLNLITAENMPHYFSDFIIDHND